MCNNETTRSVADIGSFLTSSSVHLHSPIVLNFLFLSYVRLAVNATRSTDVASYYRDATSRKVRVKKAKKREGAKPSVFVR